MILRRAGRLPAIGLALTGFGLLVAALGCQMLGVREQHQQADRAIEIEGRVSTPSERSGPLVVALVNEDRPGEKSNIVDHYVIAKNRGRFFFAFAQPGKYTLAAFHDLNSDLVYSPNEPVLEPHPSTTFALDTGDRIRGVELVVDPDHFLDLGESIDILAFQARSAGEQLGVSLGQLAAAGEVVPLSDPRFASEVGSKGLWRPFDFLFEVGFGVYFLQPYDPERIPVLFVHGISGYPQEFEALIAGLDVRRFQPWVFLYPSGAPLERIVEQLSQQTVGLRARHGFEHLLVVAHSMGGLVGRGFALRQGEEADEPMVRSLVSISTPWAGHEGAKFGAEAAPYPVDSWIDMAPGSDFLNGLFYRDIEAGERRSFPEETSFHLLFSFERKPALPGESGDGVVSLASQLRPEAQREARSLYGVNASHTGILSDPLTSAKLNALLAAASR